MVLAQLAVSMQKNANRSILISLYKAQVQEDQGLWKSVWGFLRKLDIVLPEDPAKLLLGVYPESAPTGNKDTCSTTFITALFIIARSWKEHRCPLTVEWIQKMWSIYMMEYYSFIKNKDISEDGLVGHHWKERPIGLANFIGFSTGDCQGQEVGVGG